MKVLFFCGCLEPGKDGVGDYTRRLSGELLRKGHSIKIIALNDPDTPESLETIQDVDGISINVLRLSGKESSRNRFNKAFHFIDQFNPEWLSLQFVPFSFHQKGLPWRLAKQLVLLGNGRKWHIMFHELWVGQEREANLKIRMWGLIQKNIIKAMLKRLNPILIHTQCSLYLNLLLALGYSNTHLLPLFGNIPLPESNGKVIRMGSKELALVLFGSIQPNSPVIDFSKELLEYSKRTNRKIIVRFIGRNGKELSLWIEKLKKNGIKVNHLGEKSPGEISKVLMESSIGISTTPIAQIEKSGTVASMLEHGLPVISVARSWTSKDAVVLSYPSGIIKYVKGNLERDLEKINNISTFKKNLSTISGEFLEALT